MSESLAPSILHATNPQDTIKLASSYFPPVHFDYSQIPVSTRLYRGTGEQLLDMNTQSFIGSFIPQPILPYISNTSSIFPGNYARITGSSESHLTMMMANDKAAWCRTSRHPPQYDKSSTGRHMLPYIFQITMPITSTKELSLVSENNCRHYIQPKL